MWPVLSGANMTSPRKEILVRADTLVSGDYKVILGKVSGASWAGPQYPNTSSPGHEVMHGELDCTTGCLFNVQVDPTEHQDLAIEEPARLKNLIARLKDLAQTIWHRPTTPEDPACNKTAYEVYGGFLGPWREI